MALKVTKVSSCLLVHGALREKLFAKMSKILTCHRPIWWLYLDHQISVINAFFHCWAISPVSVLQIFAAIYQLPKFQLSCYYKNIHWCKIQDCFSLRVKSYFQKSQNLAKFSILSKVFLVSKGFLDAKNLNNWYGISSMSAF